MTPASGTRWASQAACESCFPEMFFNNPWRDPNCHPGWSGRWSHFRMLRSDAATDASPQAPGSRRSKFTLSALRRLHCNAVSQRMSHGVQDLISKEI